MYVDSVEGPFVVLQANRGRGHRLVVLGADDDDDQIFLLRVRHKPRAYFCFSIREGNCNDGSAVWIYLAEVALHEVNLADAPDLLLKDVNLGT